MTSLSSPKLRLPLISTTNQPTPTTVTKSSKTLVTLKNINSKHITTSTNSKKNINSITPLSSATSLEPKLTTKNNTNSTKTSKPTKSTKSIKPTKKTWSTSNKFKKKNTTSSNTQSTWSTSTVRGGGGSRNKQLSLLTYNKLVGESDGGVELSEKKIKVLVEKYKQSWENRIYVTFNRKKDNKQCFRCKPQSNCMCGHAFRSHEWYTTAVGCRTPGCKCTCYNYLHQAGAWRLRCTCKHLSDDHRGEDGIMRKCSKKNCTCTKFHTTFSCRCGEKYEDHETVVMTAADRREAGLSVDQDIVEKRMEKIRSRKNTRNGCGRCVACKCGMSCKKGNKNPWHDPNSASLAVSKAMAKTEKIIVKGDVMKKVGLSLCDCAVQGRVCKCKH